VPLVTLRAVERFETILPIAARLLVPGGTIALLVSQPQVVLAKTFLPTAAWSDPIPIPLSTSRVLIRALTGRG
jgi:hypothetical protein